jgi:hypothetical protein
VPRHRREIGDQRPAPRRRHKLLDDDKIERVAMQWRGPQAIEVEKGHRPSPRLHDVLLEAPMALLAATTDCHRGRSEAISGGEAHARKYRFAAAASPG